MSRRTQGPAAALLAVSAVLVTAVVGCGPGANAPAARSPAAKAAKRALEVVGERRDQLITAADMIAAGRKQEVAAALNVAFDDVPPALDELAKATAGTDLEADAQAAATAGRDVVKLARKPNPVVADLEKGFNELAEKLAAIEKRTR